MSATVTATLVPRNTPTPPLGHRVLGRVHYYSSDDDVPNVTVTLQGTTQQSTQTSSAGTYQFDNVLPGTWEVGATKASDFNLGVTPLDAAYVLQTVAGLRTLDPMQALACDTTGDGTVSALDAARILQFTVGMMARLPVAGACGSDWMFVPDPAPMEAQSVFDPAIGGGACNGGTITLQNLVDEAADQDFRAVLFGDCTGNWGGGADSTSADDRSAARQAPTRRVRLGRAVANRTAAHALVYVRSSASYNALDLQIAYDATQLTPTGATFEHPTSSGMVTVNAPQPGLLRVAMASGEAITRRRGALLKLDFAVTPSATGTGAMQLVAANVDEASAIAAGGTPADRH